MRTKLRFWGVRGSLPCGSSAIGSHTSCCELEIHPQASFFFDAGTGIKTASDRRVFKRVTLFLSHFHWDHIQGLPFFQALHQDAEIEIISCYPDARERLEILFDPRFHPVPLSSYSDKVRIFELHEGDSIQREGLQIKALKLNHPGNSYAFQVSSAQNSFVFATDTDFENLNEEAEKFFEHAQVAVMDSQYLLGDALKKAHFGHSSFKKAIDVATRSFVKKAYLYSLDMNYQDADLTSMERQAKDYVRSVFGDSGCEVEMAKEGSECPIVF